MNPEDVGRILDEIGERIGPAGAYAWEITVQRIIWEGVLGVVIGSLILVAVFLTARRGHRYIIRRRDEKATRQRPYYESDDDLDTIMPIGFLWASTSVAVGLAGFEVYAGILKLSNPEYSAMVRLLEKLVP